MVLVGKTDKNFKFVDECVRTFLRNAKGVSLTTKTASELFRASMCYALKLDSEVTEDVKRYGNTLFQVYCKYYHEDLPDEEKHLLLESAVHCIESSRKKVDSWG